MMTLVTVAAQKSKLAQDSIKATMDKVNANGLENQLMRTLIKHWQQMLRQK